MIAVLFEADVIPEQQERYLLLAAELKPLLDDIDGFISIERFQSLTTSGKILSLSGGETKRQCCYGSMTLCISQLRQKDVNLSFLFIIFALLMC